MAFFSGGQSDQGYDSLSKEEERMCVRESDNLTLVHDKGRRQLCELKISFNLLYLTVVTVDAGVHPCLLAPKWKFSL